MGDRLLNKRSREEHENVGSSSGNQLESHERLRRMRNTHGFQTSESSQLKPVLDPELREIQKMISNLEGELIDSSMNFSQEILGAYLIPQDNKAHQIQISSWE